MKKQTAFTLIELLVVIVIIGILATISTATFGGALEKARLAKAQAAAAQVKTQFLAENAVAGENIFTGWYGFDRIGDVNTSNPYIIDKSEAKNNLVNRAGGGAYSQSSETGSGGGQSLRLSQRLFNVNNMNIGGPENKLTFATWLKLESLPSTTYPLFINASAGFRVNTNQSLNFYINGNNVLQSSRPIEIGSWHYIVGSYNGETETMNLWMDGDLVGTKSGVVQTASFQAPTDRAIYLGYWNFDGWLDEVMIFPFAFDGSELN